MSDQLKSVKAKFIGYWILDIGYWILDIGYWIKIIPRFLILKDSILLYSVKEFCFLYPSLLIEKKKYRRKDLESLLSKL